MVTKAKKEIEIPKDRDVQNSAYYAFSENEVLLKNIKFRNFFFSKLKRKSVRRVEMDLSEIKLVFDEHDLAEMRSFDQRKEPFNLI